jgi:hypothetical protein
MLKTMKQTYLGIWNILKGLSKITFTIIFMLLLSPIFALVVFFYTLKFTIDHASKSNS